MNYAICWNHGGILDKEDVIRVTGLPEPYVWHCYFCVRRRLGRFDEETKKAKVEFVYDSYIQAWEGKGKLTNVFEKLRGKHEQHHSV
jgi:hypothetical protein